MISLIKYLIKNLGEVPAKIISVLFHPVFLQFYIITIAAVWYNEIEKYTFLKTFVILVVVPMILYQLLVKGFYPSDDIFSPSKEVKIISIAINIISLYLLKWVLGVAVGSKVLYYTDQLILLNGLCLLTTFFFNISLHTTAVGFFIAFVVEILILDNIEILKIYPTTALGMSGSFLFLFLFFLSFFIFLSRYKLKAHTFTELLLGFFVGLVFGLLFYLI